MNELKPNSHKSRDSLTNQPIPDKKVVKVIKGSAQVHKKSGISKLADAFIQEDIANVKEYIWADVLVPTIKKAISDIINNGTDMFLYGETRGIKRSSGGVSRISYRKFYDEDRRERDRGYRERTASSNLFDGVELDTREDCEDAIIGMEEMISVYGQASIADLKDICGMVGSTTDSRYGWTNFSGSSYIRQKDGRYWLRTPRPQPLQLN